MFELIVLADLLTEEQEQNNQGLSQEIMDNPEYPDYQ